MDSEHAEKIGLWLERIMRIFLGGMFVFSGYLKVRNPELFAKSVLDFNIVGDPWPAIIGVTLPWLEIFCGIGLIIHRCYLGSLAILGTSIFVFNLALGSAWMRGLEISCGCFGDSEEVTNYALAIGRNIVLLGIALALVMMDRGAWFWGREEPADG
tara:strand:+ start:9942 stop:10409 length:468 start_codon:yes stop_codon:yes gene_type:complete